MGSAIGSELEAVIPNTLELNYRAVSETSPGELVASKLASVVDRADLGDQILNWLKSMVRKAGDASQ